MEEIPSYGHQELSFESEFALKQEEERKYQEKLEEENRRESIRNGSYFNF